VCQREKQVEEGQAEDCQGKKKNRVQLSKGARIPGKLPTVHHRRFWGLFFLDKKWLKVIHYFIFSLQMKIWIYRYP